MKYDHKVTISTVSLFSSAFSVKFFISLQMSESPDANDNPTAEVQQETENGQEEVKEEARNNEDVKKDEKKEEPAASVQPPGYFIHE